LSVQRRSEEPEAVSAPETALEVGALRALVEGISQSTGTGFFQNLVRHLAAALDVGYAFVAEFDGNVRARTVAYCGKGQLLDNVEWDVRGTPCEEVIRGELCHHPTGVQGKFPADTPLRDMGIESYLGVPLRDHDGRTLGHLAVFDAKPMPAEPRALDIFRLFASRAAAELDRLHVVEQLRQSERRYRDLYDEAPIGYVYEDTETRFISANRAAQQILGVRPDEVVGTVGLSLVAPNPTAQQRVHDSLAAEQVGQEKPCIELELRRKSDGKPVWVQRWSRPDPDGKHTRTMIIDITDRVLMEREKAQLQQQNQYLQEEIKQTHNFEEIVGKSAKLAAVLDAVRRVAATDSTVLVTGETGTGKELLARAVHSASARRDKPLIKLNCAALPTGLVESELFGHERGAFSGAIARRLGRFELAHGGTLFLDEIGELPLDVQVKLLRVLQEREFERVGGQAPIRVDVRIIAATNRDLLRSVRNQTFREDLFYRLNVFPIHLPPLRERSEDVPLLVQFLLHKFRARIGRSVDRVSDQTLKRLIEYPWPGNVRELENVLERAAILSAGPTVEIGSDVLPQVSVAAPAAPTDRLEDVERNHLLAILKQTNWVIEGPAGAAKQLDMHPNTLRSRLKKLGLQRPATHEGS